MAMAHEVEVAVIGGGAAGLSVAILLAGFGLRVVLFERDRLGGDCLHAGCIPSKALLAAAQAAQSARSAARFGLLFPAPRLDWAELKRHIATAIGTIAPKDSAQRLTALGVMVRRASACFVAPDTIAAGGQHFRFRRAVICAGSAPFLPPIPGLAEVPYLTNESVFDLPALPDHLLIIGGGATGLEMAQAFLRLGSRVSLIEAQRIAAAEDAECVAGLRRALIAEGLSLHEGAQVVALRRESEGILAETAAGQRLRGTHVLIATGRIPRLQGLGLEAAQVAYSSSGITTDRHLRSRTNRRIWAAGDIADPAGLGPLGFTHLASLHPAIIARAMLFRLPARLSYAALPRAIFTDPALLRIGPTEAELRAAGRHDFTVLRATLAENDRLVTEGQAQGLIKLLVGRRGRLIAAAAVGPRSDDLAAFLAAAIGRPLRRLATLTLPYPTVAEAVQQAVRAFYAPRLFAPPLRWLACALLRLP